MLTPLTLTWRERIAALLRSIIGIPFTSAAVLVIVIIDWYTGQTCRACQGTGCEFCEGSGYRH